MIGYLNDWKIRLLKLNKQLSMNSEEQVIVTQESQQQQQTALDEVSPVDKVQLEEVVAEAKPEVDINQPMSVLVGQGSQLRRLISAAIARVKAN